jgi:class 3 adenylate cyclase
LAARFGVEQVFMDVDAIGPGVDFTDAVRDAISTSDVLLALIGRQWLGAEDANGRRRIFLADDYLRVEVESALRRGIPVVPVLVQGATVPRPDDLPASISAFAHRNSVELSDLRWRDDVGALCAWIEQTVPHGVGAAPAEPRIDTEPSGVPENREERKVVTVLVADLATSTSGSELVDVEDVRGTVAPVQESIRQILEGFGATVDRLVGDTVMAVFGAPITHEDDVERALRAGLAIRDAVAEIGEGLELRVGIDTGEAIVAVASDLQPNQGMVSGSVVNAASHLQSAAPVGSVLVADTTYHAAERQIVFEASPSIDPTNKGQPIRCWFAIKPRSLVPILTRESFPLVGRERERRRLIDAFEACRAERTVQLVTIVGAPGIGKSRLVDELGVYVETDTELTNWRHGHVLPYGSGVAFFALTEVVKQQCGILDSDDALAAVAKLDAAITALDLEGTDARWVHNQVGPLVGIQAATDGSGQSEAFAGWRLFFEMMATESPTVLVLDDLHWADDALLNFVDELLDRIRDVPLLVIATARPELLERRPSWGGGKVNTHTIGLTPLSPEDTVELIHEIIDRSLVAPDTEALLLERSGGNPLYAQEYVRAIVERGTTTALPDTVQGLIAARLDGLSADEKSLLQDAAVIGPTSWIGAVCALGDRSRSGADDLLLRLERKELLRRARRSSIAGEVECSFTHALIREVAYAQLPRHARAERHARAAGWLEAIATDRSDNAETIAYHYTTMLALGADAGTFRSTALSALTEAAHQAAGRHDHAAVIRYADTGLTLTPEPGQRADLLVLRAVAGFTSGSPDETVLLEARDAAVTNGRREDAVHLTHLLALWARSYAADGERIADYDAAARQLAADLPPGPIVTWVASNEVFDLITSGRVDQAIELADVEVARAIAARSDVAVALLLSIRGFARAESGDDGGLGDMRDASRMLNEAAHPSATTVAYNLGILLQSLGRLSEAAIAFDTAAAAAHRSGAVDKEHSAAVALAMLAIHRGDPSNARALLDGATAGVSELNAAEDANVRGRLLLEESPNAAAAAAIRHLEFGRGSADFEIQCEALALAALAQQALSDSVRANALLDEFLQLWATLGLRVSCVPSLVEAGLVLVSFDRHDELAAAARLLRIRNPWADAALALADHRYDNAAEILDSIPSVPLRDAARRLADRQ